MFRPALFCFLALEDFLILKDESTDNHHKKDNSVLWRLKYNLEPLLTDSRLCVMQLEEEESIKNASIWAMKEYYANYTRLINDTESTPPPMDPSDVIRGPCWETAVGIVLRMKKNQLLYTTHFRHILLMFDKVTEFCITSYLISKTRSCCTMSFNEKKIDSFLQSFDPSLQIHISVSPCSCTSIKPRNNLPSICRVILKLLVKI